MYAVHFTLYAVHRSLYAIHPTLYAVHWSLYAVHPTLLLVHLYMASALTGHSRSRKENALEEIVNKVGLGHLWQRFEEESVGIKVICSVSDVALSRLGVLTLGIRCD